MRYFEDFTPGMSEAYGPVPVTAEDIVAFAHEFDPLPMHVDPIAAEASLLGGLAASGWHTCCLTMRMICDAFLLQSSSMGSPGIDELKWVRPVRPGDALTLTWTVRDARASKSRADMGLVKFDFSLTNALGERVLLMSNVVMFGRRPATVEAA